ncbi:MAG: hypothetical protein QE484_11385 [Rhizobium sp.]|nr:hypothetical protein [Rhizobium sp.]
MKGLPDPVPNARTVAGLSTIVISHVFPGGSLLRELIDQWQSKRRNDGQAILIKAIEDQGLRAFDSLTDGQLEFIVPATYLFFEQVRLGEYHHNLTVLARFVAHGVTALKRPDPGDVGRFARQLEHLSELELGVMANALALRDLWDSPDNYDFLSADGLRTTFPELYAAVNVVELRSSLALLASRGLICPDGSPQLGKTEETYFLTPQGRALGDLVRQMKVD